jgi:hypothetical protein
MEFISKAKDWNVFCSTDQLQNIQPKSCVRAQAYKKSLNYDDFQLVILTTDESASCGMKGCHEQEYVDIYQHSNEVIIFGSQARKEDGLKFHIVERNALQFTLCTFYCKFTLTNSYR